MSKELEDGKQISLDFTKLKKVAACGEDVVPAVIQNSETKDVLGIVYLNELALRETLKQRIAVFWSTSRAELWEKGKTSGDVMKLVELCINCEQNSLLLKVLPTKKGFCHTRDDKGATRTSCFYRKIESLDGELLFCH